MSSPAMPARPAWVPWLLAAMALAAASLPMTFETDAGTSSPTFIKVLFGWFFILSGQSTAWLSFPLTVLAWICLGLRKPRAALVLAAFAVGNMLPYLTGPTLSYGWGDQMHTRKQSPQGGYVVVVLAMMLTFVSALMLRRRQAAGMPVVSRTMAAMLVILLGLPLAFILSKDYVMKKVYLAKHRIDLPPAQQKFESLLREGVGARFPVRVPLPAINGIPHAKAGGIPGQLDVRRLGDRLEVYSRYAEPIVFDAWFVAYMPDESLVVCRFYPVTRVPGGQERMWPVAPRLAQGQSARLLAQPQGFGDAKTCERDAGWADLNFFVRGGSMEAGPVLFASDVSFWPRPPPDAESIHRLVR